MDNYNKIKDILRSSSELPETYSWDAMEDNIYSRIDTANSDSRNRKIFLIILSGSALVIGLCAYYISLRSLHTTDVIDHAIVDKGSLKSEIAINLNTTIEDNKSLSNHANGILIRQMDKDISQSKVEAQKNPELYINNASHSGNGLDVDNTGINIIKSSMSIPNNTISSANDKSVKLAALNNLPLYSNKLVWARYTPTLDTRVDVNDELIPTELEKLLTISATAGATYLSANFEGSTDIVELNNRYSEGLVSSFVELSIEYPIVPKFTVGLGLAYQKFETKLEYSNQAEVTNTSAQGYSRAERAASELNFSKYHNLAIPLSLNYLMDFDSKSRINIGGGVLYCLSVGGKKTKAITAIDEDGVFPVFTEYAHQDRKPSNFWWHTSVSYSFWFNDNFGIGISCRYLRSFSDWNFDHSYRPSGFNTGISLSHTI